MSVALCRNTICYEPIEDGSHTGHLLSHGLTEWNVQPTLRGKNNSDFIRKICQIPTDRYYKRAYVRWEKLIKDTENAAFWYGELSSRMYIGSGNPSSVEAGISIHQSYGTPLIPGSAIKGLVRAYARKHDIDKTNIDIIFGKEATNSQLSEAGYLIFHDAWWLPGSKETPFVPDIVTVHHPEYYDTKGKVEATDFDAPNPSSQICVRGGFFFAIEGEKKWANWAKNILTHALTHEGIGGKKSSGYGIFVENSERNNVDLPIEKQLELKITGMSIDDVIKEFDGKGWKKTRGSYETETLKFYMSAIAIKFKDDISDEVATRNEGEKKAFKRLRKCL